MYGRKQVTGFSEYWKANNIYDLAGNCYEVSQEACGTYFRGVRGGGYYESFSSLNSASSIIRIESLYIYEGVTNDRLAMAGSRPTLIIE